MYTWVLQIYSGTNRKLEYYWFYQDNLKKTKLWQKQKKYITTTKTTFKDWKT